MHNASMNEITRSWGKTLRAFRQTYALPQTRVAEELQVSQSTIARWESGFSEPPMAMKLRLAEFYNTDVAILFPLTRAAA